MKSDLQRVLVYSTLTQAAGFAKGILVAYYFGVGAELDGYYLAQVVPVTLAAVVQSVVQTGLLPVYVRLVTHGAAEEAARLAGHVLLWVLAGGLLASLALSAAATTVVSLVAPRADAATIGFGATALVVLAFMLSLNLVADLIATLLNARLRFASPALAPAANAVVSAAILFAAPDWGLQNLIWGTIAGLLVQLAILALAARRAGVSFTPSLRPPASIGEVNRSGLGILPGTLLANVSGALPQLWAAQLGSGALSIFTYANRLHGAVTQVLVLSVATVLLPHFSRLLAEKKHHELAERLSRGLPIVVALGVLASAGVWIAGEPVLRLLFERGRFDAGATTEVARIWFWLTLGLAPMVWGVSLAKVLQAGQRALALSAFAAIGLVVLVVSAESLLRVMGLAGVALAVGVMYVVNTALAQYATNRLLGGAVIRWGRS